MYQNGHSGFSQNYCMPRGWDGGSETKQVVSMAVDWLKIKTEYINGDISYRKIAEKYSIPFPTLRDRATSERWKEQRDKQRNRVVTQTEQKTVEKTSEALSEEAAAKVRIKASMMRLAEGWFVKQEEYIAEDPEKRGINPSDFRKMVQSCVELGVLDIQEPEDNDSDGLLEALSKNAAFAFEDGDDSDMVSED